jgi:uncharacterized protein (TIGR00304 family)
MEGKTLIGNTLFLLGFFIIFIGFLIIITGIVLGMREDSQASGSTSDSRRAAYEKPPEGEAKSKVKVGGVIMIGPIPIIFGSDKESAKTAIILAIILMLLSLLLFRGSLF